MTDHRSWVVMKFGGTSVSSPQRWKTIAERAALAHNQGHHVMVVVSALSGVTNALTVLADSGPDGPGEGLLQQMHARHRELARDLGLEEIPLFEAHWHALARMVSQGAYPLIGHERASLLAGGELMSSSLGAAALNRLGLEVCWQDARRMLRTLEPDPQNPLAVRCDDEQEPKLEAGLAAMGALHITQGFIAADAADRTCLLGRGGSDTSAACLAAKIGAAMLEIWTDVPGMFSADPRVVRDARLLANLGYREAQELASMGAKVLHPPSIQPARRYGIPVFIKDTSRPEFPGTCIRPGDREAEAQVKGVVSRKNITLLNMESFSMWRQAGFLADAFAVFKKYGVSIDLISTSESSVTVTLDPESAVDPEGPVFGSLLEELSANCRVEVHGGCVSISLVGNSIRTILGRIAPALDVFQDRRVHLVTQSANDLNLTLVVDPEHADSLVRKLHDLLISSTAEGRPEFGPSWEDLNRESPEAHRISRWWRERATELAGMLGNRQHAYVYDLDSIRAAAASLQSLRSVRRILYSVKANWHPRILRTLAETGVGFECVSFAEVQHVLREVPRFAPGGILFTPNFAPRAEYESALDLGVRLTLDNSWVLHEWPQLFAGREVFLRFDLERGYGHHRKVVTSGKDSKFGISLEHLDSVAELVDRYRIRVTGLHAHTGSGVGDAEVWRRQLERMLDLTPRFPAAKVLDLGGGLGVPERPGQAAFDLTALDRLLDATLAGRDLQLWLEPGRYLVAESGVLLARVTQLKSKGQHRYVGVAAGMNSLIRPALYGSYHEIVNLSRLTGPASVHARVVGPICESGDVLGESRLLPECREGDVLLIANVGAYGRAMASSYNLREPGEELFFAV